MSGRTLLRYTASEAFAQMEALSFLPSNMLDLGEWEGEYSWTFPPFHNEPHASSKAINTNNEHNYIICVQIVQLY